MSSPSSRPLEFSLFFFAQDSDGAGSDKYRLLLEAAKFADTSKFVGLWTPERHFHAFGGPYPNPSVTGAAIAAVTRRIQIRAGSVVLPLQDPLRVAEEWAVVDNLSQGRVSLAFASGASPDDFVLAPDNYGRRKEVTYERLEQVRKLWRGEALTRVNGEGKSVPISVRPRPVQKELPYWITTAGAPASFQKAGELGANLLTHLLGQDLKQLGTKIATYRDAWTRAGHAGRGRVALMLHTFVHESEEFVRQVVREPFRNYLLSSLDFLETAQGAKELQEFVSPEDRAALIDFGYERYFKNSALFGTPSGCRAQVERLQSLDVDEAACLIDFGVDTETVLSSLRWLEQLA